MNKRYVDNNINSKVSVLKEKNSKLEKLVTSLKISGDEIKTAVISGKQIEDNGKRFTVHATTA